ncbi:MAG: hypothetical protein OXH68_18615 [Gammaproteobacteria bacterium]|nr:hypothetical protein [Gammaproteobacteria bacterium]
MKIVEKSNDRTTLRVHREELRAFLGAIGEAFEVVERPVFETRMGATAADVRRIEDELAIVYRKKGRRKKICVSEQELVTIRNALTASLELDDWEFPIRMGFTKAEVRSILAEVSDIVTCGVLTR